MNKNEVRIVFGSDEVNRLKVKDSDQLWCQLCYFDNPIGNVIFLEKEDYYEIEVNCKERLVAKVVADKGFAELDIRDMLVVVIVEIIDETYKAGKTSIKLLVREAFKLLKS